MSNRLSHPKPAPPPRGAPWKARSCGWVNRRSSGIKLEGLTTPSVISMVTETDTVVATLPQPQIEEEEGKADFSTGNDRRRQRMTRRPMDKLLSTKYRTRLGTWEMNRYNIEVLGLCEVRWNTFGKVTLSTGQVLLYSGKENEEDPHEAGKEHSIARSALDWNPQGKRKRGRPKNTWRRGLQSDLDNIGMTWGEAKQRAKNRTRWRTAVDALCPLWDE